MLKDLMKKEDRLETISRYILDSLIIISLVTSIFTYINLSNINYDKLFLLPFFQALCLAALLYFNINIFKGIGTFLIVVTFFFRLTFEPALMTIGNYASDFSINIINSNIDLAIYLLIYELFFVTVFLIKFNYKREQKSFINNQLSMQTENIKVKYSKLFKYTVLIMAFVCILSVIISNELIHYFSFFFKNNTQAANQVELIKEMVNVTPSIIYYPFKLIIELLRVLFAPMILIYINSLHFDEKYKIAFSLSILVLILCISSQEQINSVLIVFASALLIIKMYPKYAYRFLLLGAIMMSVFIVFGLFTYSGIGDFDRMSQVVQAYFSGPSNVAMGITIGRERSFDYLLGDFFRNIPIFATFFKDMIVTNDYMNIIGNLTGGASITPFISDGYIYFGEILSIIPTTLIICLICKMEEKLYTQSCDAYTYFIYSFSVIIIAICPVLYSVGIFYSYMMSMIIPLIIFDKVRLISINKNSKGEV